MNFLRVDQIPENLRLHLLREIDKANLWHLHTSRQEQVCEQAETQSIVLRSADPDPGYSGSSNHVQRSKDVMIDRFPVLKSVIGKFSIIARAMIVRLAPWGQVYKHVDHGAYYDCRDRFHLVLQSMGSDLTCGDECQILREGEIWWFHNSLPHQAFNFSGEWRIHVIFDTESNTYKDKYSHENIRDS